MKRLTVLVIVAVCLVGLGLVWNAQDDSGFRLTEKNVAAQVAQGQLLSQQDSGDLQSALVQTNRQARVTLADSHQVRLEGQQAPTNTPAHPLPVQPTNTPAPPIQDSRSVLTMDTSPSVGPQTQERTQSQPSRIEPLLEEDMRNQQTLQLAQVLPPDEARLSLADQGIRAFGQPSSVTPSSAAETCMTMLLNPQMDVTEFGDETGSIDYWSILDQIIYYSKNYYASASYSLEEKDELDGSDTVGIWISGTYYDYDEFGQGFGTPAGLTSLRVDFNRLYSDPDAFDIVYVRFWTLDNQGYLDELIAYGEIPTDPNVYPPDTWHGFYMNLTAAQLVQASNKPIALVFTMFSDQVAPGMRIYLDDAQVTLCYKSGAEKIFLPHAARITAPEPKCSPLEPDGVSNRGITFVDKWCNGSFSATDMKDYYTLNLDGVANVRLCLQDLPAGSNWDGLIYEDSSGYPLGCHIGTPGDQNKCRDCPALNPSKSYFLLVNAGTAPSGGANTYNLGAVKR